LFTDNQSFRCGPTIFLNTETTSIVTINVTKRETKEIRKKPPETKSYREAMEEFFEGRSDFSKRGGNVSAVLPQGSPGPLKEDPKTDDSDEE
jgi:hypothetical protein